MIPRDTMLVTGCAGFIGSHLSESLLKDGYSVIGVDCLDSFLYPRSQKELNLELLGQYPHFDFFEMDLNFWPPHRSFQDRNFRTIFHLAAKPGVMASLEHPEAYLDTNVKGTLKLLEWAKSNSISNFVFASTSSVYGRKSQIPFREDSGTESPISPYATTKYMAEILCETYSYLHQIKVAVLRLFTVYGPRQRPDLAIRTFFDKIYHGDLITVFGDGRSRRDYTYIADTVHGLVLAEKWLINQPRSTFEVFNLGCQQTVDLISLLSLISEVSGKKPRLQFVPERKAEMIDTFADITKSKAVLGYAPKTTLEAGLYYFNEWYLSLDAHSTSSNTSDPFNTERIAI